MRILIIEDEKPAFERLSKMLNEYENDISVYENITGIKDAVKWFTQNRQPDLILLDIQLSDGLSFEIFENVRITCPVIFTTAFDEYILDAFNFNGIDYLLKPVKKEKLFTALNKYKNLKEHFSVDYLSLLNNIQNSAGNFKERYTVKNGTEFLSIPVGEIAYFYSEYKLVFVVTKTGKKYLFDKNLTAVEEGLDPKIFFRINRNYITSIEAIKSYKPFFKGKLLIALNPPVKENVYVSQEKSTQFKQWLEQ